MALQSQPCKALRPNVSLCIVVYRRACCAPSISKHQVWAKEINKGLPGHSTVPFSNIGTTIGKFGFLFRDSVRAELLGMRYAGMRKFFIVLSWFISAEKYLDLDVSSNIWHESSPMPWPASSSYASGHVHYEHSWIAASPVQQIYLKFVWSSWYVDIHSMIFDIRCPCPIALHVATPLSYAARPLSRSPLWYLWQVASLHHGQPPKRQERCRSGKTNWNETQPI